MNIEIKKKHIIIVVLCFFVGCVGCVGAISDNTKETTKNNTIQMKQEQKKGLDFKEENLNLTDYKCELDVVLSNFDKLPNHTQLKEIGDGLTKKYNKSLTIVRFFVDKNDVNDLNIYSKYINGDVFINPDAVAKNKELNSRTEEANEIAKNNKLDIPAYEIIAEKDNNNCFVVGVITRDVLTKEKALRLCNIIEARYKNVNDLRIVLQSKKEANRQLFYIKNKIYNKLPE